MMRSLSIPTKKLVLAIPACMALGLAFGAIFPVAWLKSLIPPLTFLMVYPMMVGLRAGEVFKAGDARLQAVTQIVNFLVIPFLAYGLGMAFFPNQPAMALGLLLAGLVPTSGMTISWTGMAGGNVAGAVKMTVIGLTLGSLLTPVYVAGLLGAEVQADVGAAAAQIGLIVFLPMLAGILTRKALVKRYGRERFAGQLAPKMPVFSTLGVLGIVFTAMALKAETILADPGALAVVVIPLVLLYGVNFLLATLTGKLLFKRGDAIALVYGSVMRNLSIALGISLNAFGTQGSTAALVIALAYVVQVQAAAWYVRFTPAIFGEEQREAVQTA